MEEEEESRLRRGRDAKELLSHPLVEEFFKARFRECYDAFMSLPFGATLEQYQAVHMNLRSLQDLRSSLAQHVTVAKSEVMRQALMSDKELDV